MTRPKAKNGTVQIQTVKDRLRLCWSINGKREYLSLGLPDSKINRAAAQLTDTRIEEDIRTGNYDLSKPKYAGQQSIRIAIGTLFDRYWNSKRHKL